VIHHYSIEINFQQMISLRTSMISQLKSVAAKIQICHKSGECINYTTS